MFATLLGPLPRPPLPPDAPVDDLVRAAVEAQATAGLEPITDGGQRHARPAERLTVEDWRETAALTERAVKQVLVGPFSAGRSPGAPGADLADITIGHAAALNAELRSLAAAGCPLVEIHEPAIVAIGADGVEWDLFAEAAECLLDGLDGLHVSLAITGGSIDPAGIPIIAAVPFASVAVDLVAGPDNWRLVTALPAERGVVAGALSTAEDSNDGPELLLWALGYAASTNGRGAGRVGLATASGLAALGWPAALAKMARLGEVIHLAGLEPAERAARLDPRATDIRSAAAGRFRRPPGRSGGPGR